MTARPTHLTRVNNLHNKHVGLCVLQMRVRRANSAALSVTDDDSQWYPRDHGKNFRNSFALPLDRKVTLSSGRPLFGPWKRLRGCTALYRAYDSLRP
jgi:hypothetical protein